MVNAGRVAIVPQGEWSADATYKRLDAVTNNNTLYFAKKEVPAGTETTNTEYWSKSIVGDAGAIATTEAAGIVKPDGTTITIDEDGTIHGQSEITVDGTTITIDEAKGIISLAKTLQDKIKTIDNKLPKTSVVNTNTTTEAGFALDARQANPNIAGTLAANILQLNNDSLNMSNYHNQDVFINLSSYTDLLDIIKDMSDNSMLYFSEWTPKKNFPDTYQSFWQVYILRGASIDFTTILVSDHNGVNSISKLWLGTYGVVNDDIVWRSILT